MSTCSPCLLISLTCGRSLCKAAAIQQLIAAACKVARRVLRYVPCATTLLTWVNKAASYVLAYTVAFIGIYGLSFNEGALHCLYCCCFPLIRIYRSALFFFVFFFRRR